MDKRKSTIILFVATIIVVCAVAGFIKMLPYIHSQKEYSAEELGITELTSSHDKDDDGIDDYTDILLGARAYIETNPTYKSKYYEGGYPDDGYGVCTDVIWNALQAAGYNLKDIVDEDIAKNHKAYEIEEPDPNIDFRRVRNLHIFFGRNMESLTTSFDNPEKWQAGDIVVFKSHIAICSNKRNNDGIPFIIHHGNIVQGAIEINEIENYTITGHYRWNAE